MLGILNATRMRGNEMRRNGGKMQRNRWHFVVLPGETLDASWLAVLHADFYIDSGNYLQFKLLVLIIERGLF